MGNVKIGSKVRARTLEYAMSAIDLYDGDVTSISGDRSIDSLFTTYDIGNIS